MQRITLEVIQRVDVRQPRPRAARRAARGARHDRLDAEADRDVAARADAAFTRAVARIDELVYARIATGGGDSILDLLVATEATPRTARAIRSEPVTGELRAGPPGRGRPGRRAGRGHPGLDQRRGRRARRRRARAGLGPGRTRRGAVGRGWPAGRGAHPVRRARAGPLVAVAPGGGRTTPMTAVLAPAAFDVCGAAPHRHHRARGQRRHREDVHDRRARRPLRRRGRGDAARADARHVRPRGHHRAAGTGAGAACWPPSAPSPIPPRPAPALTSCTRCSPTRPTPRSPGGGRGWCTRSPRSTPPPSPPPTSSASRCWPGSAWRRVPTRTRCSSSRWRTCSARSSTTSMCASTATGRWAAAVRPGGGAGAGPGGGLRRAGPVGAVGRRARLGRGHALPVRRGRARRGRAAQARAARLHLRRHAHPPRRRAVPLARSRGPAAGALPGGAGRRVPGHRPGAVVDPAPRLPRAHRAGADRRPQAGHLRVPRRRRRHVPGGHAHGRAARHAGRQPPQRRAAARRPRGGVRRRRARRRADRRAPGGGGAGRSAAGRGARKRPGAGAGGLPTGSAHAAAA